LLNDEVFAVDVYAVTDVVGVFDEEEDAGAKEFLDAGCEDEGEGKEGCSGCCEGCDEVGILECNYFC
jgi:hypothetical protein